MAKPDHELSILRCYSLQYTATKTMNWHILRAKRLHHVKMQEIRATKFTLSIMLIFLVLVDTRRVIL